MYSRLSGSRYVRIFTFWEKEKVEAVKWTAPPSGPVCKTHLESISGDGVILVSTGPWLAPPPTQTDPKHVHIDEDILVMVDVLLPELDHQLPKDVR